MAAATPQPTTFPRPIFARLSPHPYLVANLQQPSDTAAPPRRINGRAPRQSRPVNVNAGSLSHAHGSAVVRLGDTTVICGVRGEILPVVHIPNYRDANHGEDDGTEDEGARRRRRRRELQDYDLLVPNIELATGCGPEFLPGVPPSTLAQTLSSRVHSLLHASELLDVDQLRIWSTPAKAAPGGDNIDEHENEEKPKVRAYWTLYIDLLFISFDGNPFDAAWTAVVAALRDTTLPCASWDADREAALCSRALPARALSVRGCPVACSAAVLRPRRDDLDAADDMYWVLVDPDRLEEELCDEFVSVIVNRSTEGSTTVLALLKMGGTAAGADFVKKMVEVAEERWDVVKAAMP